MASTVCYNKAVNVRKYSCDDKAPHTETKHVSEPMFQIWVRHLIK